MSFMKELKNKFEISNVYHLLTVFAFCIGCGKQTTFSGATENARTAATSTNEEGASQDQTLEAPAADSSSDMNPVVKENTPDVTEGSVEVKPSNVNVSNLSIIREYVSGKSVPTKIEVDVVNKRITQTQTLKKETITVKNVKDFVQSSYPMVTDKFTQGSAVTKDYKEEFAQESQGILDLLIVVDNSGSMEEEQQNLATKLKPLISYIDNSFWQIGVVTTDGNDPCLRSLIKKGDGDIEASFSNAIKAGTSGDYIEKGILAATRALGFDISDSPYKNCSTQWIRANSSIAVLIVSDEDNCSNGRECSTDPWSNYNYLSDKLSKIRVLGNNARVYGLFAVPKTSCSTADNVANIYNDLVNTTHGIAGSICDADYSETLMQISKDVATILKSQFILQSKPDDGTLKVYINDTLLTTGYHITDTTLTFDVPPASGSSISVMYKTTASVTLKDFSLSEKPVAGSISVDVDGVLLSTSAYSVDYGNKILKFQSPPADNASIKAVYKKDIALGKTYDLGSSVLKDSIEVMVNNDSVEILSFDSSSGILTLKSTPPESAAIHISYKSIQMGDPITSFPLVTPWNNVRDLNVKYVMTGEKIMATWENGVLSIAPDVFLEGKEIAISYRDESDGYSRSFELPSLPIDGNVSVDGVLVEEGKTLACSSDEVNVDGLMVTSTCDLTDADKVSYSYRYYIDLIEEIIVSEVANADSATWTVWVDGVITNDYVRTDNRIKFSHPVMGGKVVKVEAKYK
ncbi:MAG: hypothetical protein R3B45_01345 [Bdellovibrionota bacterium]